MRQWKESLFQRKKSFEYYSICYHCTIMNFTLPLRKVLQGLKNHGLYLNLEYFQLVVRATGFEEPMMTFFVGSWHSCVPVVVRAMQVRDKMAANGFSTANAPTIRAVVFASPC
jgi:hypothetical protein